MKTLKHLCAALPLFALLLAGCAGTGPTSGERPDPGKFIAMASQSPCAGGANRLFVIDDKFVYWDRGNSCQDQVLRLYGADPDRPLCVYLSSAKGPYTSCTDASARAMFDIILGSRQDADLGLGAGHTVAPLGFVPEVIVNLVFQTALKESFSAIHERRTVVVRSAAQWARLWAEHTAGQVPTPPLPEVDFTRDMLVGIFAGDLKGCHEFEIRRVNVERNNIEVEFEDRDITPYAFCIAAVTNPVHFVAVPAIETEVVFTQITPGRREFGTIDRSTYSGIQEPVNLVIREADTWAQVWNRHSRTTGNVPAIDFHTTMVIGVFRGVLPNGCFSTEIVDVYNVGSGLNIHRLDTVPGENALCTLALVSPAHLIAVPRSDESVVFSAERRQVPLP